MALDLMKVINEPGSTLEVDETLDISSIDMGGSGNAFPNGAKVSLKLKNIMECVTLSLHCEFEYSTECARCLKPLLKPVEFDFDSVVKVTDDVHELLDEDAVVIDSSNRLDLQELVEGLVIMNLPMKVLCSDDCKGLCPQCGKDLNEGECGCNKKEVDPRFAKLKELLDNDRS